MAKYYIKAGDEFELPYEFYDEDADTPIEVTDNMEITSSIAMSINGVNKIIATCQVEVMDQVSNKGFIVCKVPSSVTKSWPAGIAVMDVKVTIDGKPKTSETLSFEVDRSITP